MKKLLSIALIFTASAGFAQICTPDVSCVPSGTAYGICPDSATGLAPGTVGVAYNQVLSMKVPPNGADFGYPTATITSIDIISVDSLAPGLTYACAPTGCSFPGNSNGCIVVSGTPTQVWNKRIIVNAMANATIFGFPASLPQTNEQYRSVVVAPAGVETLDLTKFDVNQNVPNPFSGKTTIEFSALAPTDIEFKVFNLLGAVVYQNKFRAEKGANSIMIEANSFAPGAYIYSVKNGDKTITKRMIVSNK